MADDPEKKLIIDEDWKAEAQREKEILAEQEKAVPKAGTPGGGERGPLPSADFQGLVSMFVTQAYLALGLLRLREDEEPKLDLEMAQYNIDMLGILEAKTKGNLEPAEVQMLEEVLQNLRMAFVQLSSSPS